MEASGLKDEPLFDSVFALVMAAEADGFEAVAQALELVLDVYLKEREVVFGTGVEFVSCRSSHDRDVAAFEADALDDQSSVAAWSVSHFPLARVC